MTVSTEQDFFNVFHARTLSIHLRISSSSTADENSTALTISTVLLKNRFSFSVIFPMLLLPDTIFNKKL